MRRPEIIGALLLAFLAFGCGEHATQPDASSTPTFAKGRKAACPIPADIVVNDEATLLAALAAANQGDVIGLDAFFDVTADVVVVTTDNVTLTCATAGSGLFWSGGNGSPFSLLRVESNDVRVDRLTLDGTGVTTAAFIPGDRPTFSNNDVTCGAVCAWFNGSTGPVITDNDFDGSAAGVFSAIQIQSGTTDALVTGNTVVGSGNTGIRIRSGANYVLDHNTVLGSWQRSMMVVPIGEALTGSEIKSNHLEGATRFGLTVSVGGLDGFLATGNLVRNNRITGAGEVGVFVNLACGNTFQGNNLNGNANNVGLIFETDTGANTLKGNKNVVVDNGDFDCDGDGVPDPNIIGG